MSDVHWILFFYRDASLIELACLQPEWRALGEPSHSEVKWQKKAHTSNFKSRSGAPDPSPAYNCRGPEILVFGNFFKVKFES